MLKPTTTFGSRTSKNRVPIFQNILPKSFSANIVYNISTVNRSWKKHVEDCIVLTKCQAIEMPAEGTVTKFKSFRETFKIPFVVHADMESILEKLTVAKEQTSDMRDSDMSASQEQENTEKLQNNVACSYGYKVVCCYDGSMSKPFKMYRELDSVNKFFTDIFEEEKEILEKLKQFHKTPINLSIEEKVSHKNAKTCYVCENNFINENRKVRDLCHVTGSYRGASCNKCNLSMKLTKTIPVIFPQSQKI